MTLDTWEGACHLLNTNCAYTTTSWRVEDLRRLSLALSPPYFLWHDITSCTPRVAPISFMRRAMVSGSDPGGIH